VRTEAQISDPYLLDKDEHPAFGSTAGGSVVAAFHSVNASEQRSGYSSEVSQSIPDYCAAPRVLAIVF
jgi:hypothetical protein